MISAGYTFGPVGPEKRGGLLLTTASTGGSERDGETERNTHLGRPRVQGTYSIPLPYALVLLVLAASCFPVFSSRTLITH